MPRLLVMGVGGAGCNAVDNMVRSKLIGVDFIVANTDAQALGLTICKRRVQLGRTVSGSLGAGAKIEVGARAAEEALDEIRAILSDYDMVFITAGMGGGTGTGAAPVIAAASREMGLLTVAVVTTPFAFEGMRRATSARQGLISLEPVVDTLLVIPNQNLFFVSDRHTSFMAAFAKVDEVLYSAVRAVSDLLVSPGMVNLDFADVRIVMKDAGKAMIGTGEGSGNERAINAAKAAVGNPLFDRSSIKGAQSLLINISGGRDLTLFEADEVVSVIQNEVGGDCFTVFGALLDETLNGTIRVSVVAAGLDKKPVKVEAPITAEQATPEASPEAGKAPAEEADLLEAGPPDEGFLSEAHAHETADNLFFTPEPEPLPPPPQKPGRPIPGPGPWRGSPSVALSSLFGRGINLIKGAKDAMKPLDGGGKDSSEDDRSPVLVGFDFGTAWTAVVSNRGHKKLIRTVVGYPKDVINAKLMGAPFLIGEKAYEMRSYVDLRHPLSEGVLREYVERDVETARHFVNHVIKSLFPRPESRICVMVGVPARASEGSKIAILRLFKDFVDEVQVISEPFLVAYGQGKLIKSLIVDIGAGTVDVCALRGAMPGQSSQITVNIGGNFIDQQLMVNILKEYPDVLMNAEIAGGIKERFSFVGESADLVMADLRSGGRPVSYNVTDAIRCACEMLLPPIVDGIKRLIGSLSPEEQAVMLNNIVLSGGGSRIKGIDRYIVDKMRGYGEVSVSCVPDPEYAVAAGALKLAQDLPPKEWSKLGGVSAF
nr:Magnetosome protein MamK (MreB-actin-like) [uncultured bacterium]